jgi:hypothetical protein
MPAKDKNPTVKGRPRAPAGKKQMLVIMDAELVRQVKIAAAEDERKVSHVVEDAVRDWLAKRSSKRQNERHADQR